MATTTANGSDGEYGATRGTPASTSRVRRSGSPIDCVDWSKIKGIAFDWSGTLSDDIVATHLAALRLGKSLEFEVDGDPIAWGRRPTTNQKTDIEQRIAEALKTGNSQLATSLSALGDSYASLYRFELHAVVNGQSDRATGRCVPTPVRGAIGALRILRETMGQGFQMAVISAHPCDMLAADVDRYQIPVDMFASVQGDCFDKSARLTALCLSWRLDAGQVAYVGDTTGDVAAAKRAGVVSVGVTSGYHTLEMIRDAAPDATFETVADFVDAFLHSVSKTAAASLHMLL
jgi:phosphoglycolate phosphatase-like HAD superfamily hydrolase